MPYEIKEMKGSKMFSVVNKDNGRVMSKGTTKTKAEKQIKAIYANMKPEHRIRHRIGLLHDRPIKSGVHKELIKIIGGLLKKEEIEGNGLWSWLEKSWKDTKNFIKSSANKAYDTFDILNANKNPVLNLVLTGFAQDPVKYLGEALSPQNVLTAVEILAPEIAPIAEIAKAFIPGDPLKITPPKKLNAQIEEDEEDDDDLRGDSMLNRLDKITEKIVEQTEKDSLLQDANSDHPFFIDEAIRFPLVYNYDENIRPMKLAEFLIYNGVAGANFSKEEFGNTYLNQKPYAFLNHPLNGGNLGKIDYSRLGYSKY